MSSTQTGPNLCLERNHALGYVTYLLVKPVRGVAENAEMHNGMALADAWEGPRMIALTTPQDLAYRYVRTDAE